MEKERISIFANSIALEGVTSVISIFEKDAVVNTNNGIIDIVGQGITASKLELDKGLMVLSFESISDIRFGKQRKKMSLSNLFK